MSTLELDRIVEEYLRQLDAALKRLPEERRRHLVDEVRSHIAEGRALIHDPTEADIRTLLERLGPPEEIASESLITDRATEPASRRRLWLPAGIAAALAAAGLAVGLVVGLGGGTQSARTLRPPAPTTTTTAAVVVLPTFRGEPETRATAALSAVGLRSVVETAATAIGPRLVPKGTVLSQTPVAGARVAPGSPVTLIVSPGPSSS
jgi:PASTA domain